MSVSLTPNALKLILDHEGWNEPGKWPGGQSGITLGHGYDLGYKTLREFQRDWGNLLSPTVFNRLAVAVGKRGDAAREIAADFKDIRIPREAADEVFETNSIPWAIRETRKIFQIDLLPPDAAGALVSLVYNRGAATEGATRKEMRAIQLAVLRRDLPEIAAQLRSMKRLWEGKRLDGLLRRREDEAKLVESCINA